ncbi:MAG: hypothetical protein JWQ90_1688 [Hydrocarboniphaga sp.]|uniref:ShlB/FhaC/HecB family hemolysin secretion/activation protein n=1 Tax=Hydrocarboniphaga sp. TaxID=2033016 RepID=UPI002629F69D|nr:ShlB/FhaC/HecB family hemolysin secretion/activation protein [Hydrocarboniphaga sp.]MDB5969238.1 hypothetical protein [Hydrocarboniphaga sp.]
MAVTLPPVLPPQQGAAEQLQQQGSEIAAFAFQNYQVHLLGTPVLSPEAAASAASGAESLSDVVRNLGALYYGAGYPATQITYGLAGQDLYVVATPGRVTSVTGPAELTPYFQHLVGTAPLTDDALEPRRALASIHADRAGMQSEPVLSSDGSADGYTMDLRPLPDSPDPTSLKAEFGNPGNRFVGRHFLDLDIRHAFTTGDELAATWRSGLPGLNGDDDAEDYHEESLSWSRVTRWGIFGLSGRNVDYSIDIGAVPVNGDLQQAEAAWLFPILGNFQSRLTVNAKVDYTNKEVSLRSNGAVAQSQEYGSVEAGSAYSHIISLGGTQHLDLDAGVAVRKGLGDDKTGEPTTLADQGYLLFRPQASARYAFDEHLSTRLDLYAQITSDTVPEQSQWVMGGLGNIVSYLPGVATGDSGGLARLQIEYKDLGDVYGLTFTPRVFAEYGYTKYENTIAGLPDGTPTIADAGAELVAAYASWLEASVAYAHSFYDKDIDQQTLDDSEANLYFRLTLKL